MLVFICEFVYPSSVLPATVLYVLRYSACQFVVDSTNVIQRCPSIATVLCVFGAYKYLALYLGPFKKSDKRAWYPLFAHALN